MEYEILIEESLKNLGKFCRKYNGKPFKSGEKVNTLKYVINHPILNIPAYTFFEDDSYVECRRVVILNQ